jgi:hypothetical protein
MILFDNLPNDLTITDHDDPLSVFIHTDSEDKEDTVGIPHPPEVEFSTDFKPTYALNIPLENCEESLTMWYEFTRDNDRDCYYPHVDCGGHKHDAVREVFRFELNKPAVIDVSVPHGVYNPHKERRTVATFRFYNVTGSDGIHPTNPDGLMWNLMNARTTGQFNLFGNDYNTIDGSCVRDYTHVNEICHAVIQGIEQSTNQIENLGHGVGTSVKQMIEIFQRVNNCQFETVVCPRREGDLETSVLDNPSVFMQHLYTIDNLLKI